MDFKEKASKCFPNKSLFADAILMWQIILNIENALKEAHSLGVKQGREEQRAADAKIAKNIHLGCKGPNDLEIGYRKSAQIIEKEILSAKGGKANE